MENKSLEDLEEMIIFAGSYLFNSGDIENVDTTFLIDLNKLLVAEIEKRGATIH